ncbi:MAG: RDD family protein [Bacillota bacterium]
MTEGVVNAEKHVSVGLRFVAIIVDSIILFIVAYLIAIITGGTTAGGFELQGAPFFLFSIIALLYYWLLEAFLGGTVGKLVLGMRVQMADGSPCTIGASLIRNLLRIVDGLFFYLVAAILVWTSPTRQRLGDRLAGTVVVKK